MCSKILVEVKGDFAVRAGLESVTGLLKFLLYAFIIVELAIYDNLPRPVFVRDRLIASGQVNDAQPCVSKSDVPIWRYPIALAIRPAMPKSLGRLFERLSGDWCTRRENGNNSAHLGNSSYTGQFQISTQPSEI